MTTEKLPPEKNLSPGDWFLIAIWLGFVVWLGPALLSARSTVLVLLGFLILAALLNFSAWRLYPILKRKFK